MPSRPEVNRRRCTQCPGLASTFFSSLKTVGPRCVWILTPNLFIKGADSTRSTRLNKTPGDLAQWFMGTHKLLHLLLFCINSKAIQALIKHIPCLLTLLLLLSCLVRVLVGEFMAYYMYVTYRLSLLVELLAS